MQLLNIGDRLAAIELTDSTPDELGAFIKAETERWALADGVTRHLGTSVSTSFAKARVFGQHRARDGGAETEAAIGGLLDRSHLGNFLYVDDQARSHDAGAHCTSRSVPPARTRAALPAPANALIASSSVRGAKYRTSVMVIPAVSLIRAPACWWLPQTRRAYMGKNDWNSLFQVKGPMRRLGSGPRKIVRLHSLAGVVNVRV